MIGNKVACIDLEGVLIPELWPVVAASSGVAEIALTTREVRDFHALMERLVTPTTLGALQDAEAKLQAAQASKREIEKLQPADVLPRVRELHQKLVSELEQLEDVSAAREAIRAIVGEIRLVPEGDELVAEMTSAGLAGACQLTLVAGAGFERQLKRMRIRLVRQI